MNRFSTALIRPKWLIRRQSSSKFISKGTEKLKKHGLPLVCVYGCLDGVCFISTAIVMYHAQEEIIGRLENWDWFKRHLKNESVSHKIHEKLEKMSRWWMMQKMNLGPADLIAAACAMLVLRGPLSVAYRGTVISIALWISTRPIFQRAFQGHRQFCLASFVYYSYNVFMRCPFLQICIC